MTENKPSRRLTGKCLRGAVAFEADCTRGHFDACHCSLCRRWSGSYWMSVNVPFASLKVTKGEEQVGWFRSSKIVRRGFCKNCGSALFWHPDRHPEHGHILAIGVGSLDAPTGLTLSEHIFVADKGDYYEITDGLPQKQGY
jgi:hypothetical protein